MRYSEGKTTVSVYFQNSESKWRSPWPSVDAVPEEDGGGGAEGGGGGAQRGGSPALFTCQSLL